MSTFHTKPRVTLLTSAFSVVLPFHQAKIPTRYSRIARFHHEAKQNPLATHHTDTLNSLEVELEMLEHDVPQYKGLIDGIDIVDIAGLYEVSGMAKDDIEGSKTSLCTIAERVKEVRADMKYEFRGIC